MEKKLTNTILTSKDYAAILWILKLKGDINENYKGGRATRTLRLRLVEAGFPVDAKRMNDKVKYLKSVGLLEVLSSGAGRGTNIFCIRLNKDLQHFPPNPFSNLKAETNDETNDEIVEQSIYIPEVELVGEMKDNALIVKYSGQIYRAELI